MEIINLGKDVAVDNDYGLSIVNSYGATAIIYKYTQDDYEGYGHALILINGQWYLHDMGHCSCYGPLCEFNLDVRHEEELDNLFNSCSTELQKDIEDIFIRAKEWEKFR